MKIRDIFNWKWIFGVCCAITVFACFYTNGTSAEPSGTATETVAPDNVSGNALAPDDSAPSIDAPASTNEVDIPIEKPITPPENLSPGIAELARLAQSGVGEDVLMAYVNNSSQDMHPSADEIIYPEDLGISETVIAAAVNRQSSIPGRTDVAQLAQQQSAASPVNVPQQNQLPITNQISENFSEPNTAGEAVTAPLVPQDTATVAQQPVDVGYFQDTLSPYGTWVTLPEYGACWQPTVVVVDRSWRPYTNRGRWVYTTCGWYWQSDYSWGWAPFHYGRWYCDNRIGWVWVPGSVWGPAWVSWRYTNDYCGWAPLPPSARFDGVGLRFHNARVGISFDFGLRADFYTFVPTSHFCDRNPSRYFVPRNSRTTIYSHSVVINNYIRGNNHTVINEGISKDRIDKAARTKIRTVALRDLPTTSHNPIGRADHFQGNSLEVFRPNVSRSNSSRLRDSSRRTSPSSTVNTRHDNVPATQGGSPVNQNHTRTSDATRQSQFLGRQQTGTMRPSRTIPVPGNQNENNRVVSPSQTPAPSTSPQRNFPTRVTPSANNAAQNSNRQDFRERDNSISRQQNVIRSAPVAPPQISQPQPQTQPRQFQPPVRQDNSTPRSSEPRSLRQLPTRQESPRQESSRPSVSAPTVNRGIQVDRSAPRSIQPRVSAPQTSPRSQPSQSSRPDRSDRSGRDRNH
jgi:hypothetical protein